MRIIWQNENFSFQFQVLQLKQKIETERGKEYAVEQQKLIYAGKLKNFFLLDMADNRET